MLEPKYWHPRLTQSVIAEAVERRMTTLDNPGLCVSCGNEQGGCEPDARRIRCESCGDRQVYGADELFMEIA